MGPDAINLSFLNVDVLANFLLSSFTFDGTVNFKK